MAEMAKVLPILPLSPVHFFMWFLHRFLTRQRFSYKRSAFSYKAPFDFKSDGGLSDIGTCGARSDEALYAICLRLIAAVAPVFDINNILYFLDNFGQHPNSIIYYVYNTDSQNVSDSLYIGWIFVEYLLIITRGNTRLYAPI